ncbi:MAG: DNA translocase FtsK [Caldilineaceae bacterium]
MLGLWITWAFVTFLAISGLIFLLDQLLVGVWVAAIEQVQTLRQLRERQPRPTGIDPVLPLPSGKIGWWKEWRVGWRQPAPTESVSTLPRAANMVQPIPSAVPLTRPERARPPASPPAPNQATPAARTTAAPLTPGEGERLTPRIVGSAQEWRLPRLEELLNNWERHSDSDDLIRQQGRMIQETLALFGVPADFEGAYKGPAVTQYLIKPGYVERTVQGETKRIKVKVAKIAGLANDLALALAAPSVRIEAPIPGTNYVGVEVPNQEGNIVGLRDLMESDVFQQSKARLRIALGEDVKGQPIISDMTRMPHLLIAGATGTGKSVCINSIINCLLLTNTPDNLRLLMVDPKMVELSVYNGIPHLLSPVVTEVDKAAGVLFWAVKEMERRYSLCSKVGGAIWYAITSIWSSAMKSRCPIL